MNHLATTAYGVTWMPLLAVQRRSRAIGYHMPVREHGSAAEATAAGLAARGRLRAVPLALPAPKPVPEPLPVPVEALPVAHERTPLNMLGHCHWRFLVALAAARHGCTAKDILGKRRQPGIVAARHEAMYLTVRHTSYSIARVGRMFDRDHTTILACLQKFPAFARPRVSPIATAPAISIDPTAAYTERLKIVTEGYTAGMSTGEIAQQIGMSRSTVKALARKHSLRHPARPFYVAEAA